jgi:hypothetical protein
MGHMGEGGMMLHPISLPTNATSTTTAQLSVSERGDYTPLCHRECGYGHEYMYLDGAFVGHFHPTIGLLTSDKNATRNSPTWG